MKVSGLYYVAEHAPSSSSTGPSTLLQTLVSTVQKYPATPLPRWSLDHHLHRATTTPSGDAKAATYHHVLSLSYHPGKTFLHTHPPSASAEPGHVAAIPATQTASFLTLLNTKLSALWTQRQALIVRDGHAFSIGELIIRVGELRSAQRVGGNPPALQGVVICIESRAGNVETTAGGDASAVPSQQEMEETVRDTHEMIKALWSDLDVQGRKEGIKEVLSQPEGPREEQALWAEVRMWCEALKLRS